MTNEPGIYIREDALSYLTDTPENRAFIAKVKPAFEKYKNIGVRIEDDMLITETGVEWMTKKLPRSLADVEAFMAKSSKEMPNGNAILEKGTNANSATLARNGNFLLPDYQFNAFNLNGFPQGATARKGWIWSGKQAAQAGLNHVGHSHGE
jgi:hypothetical protein